MPIRTASFAKRLSDNGRAMHRARMSREAQGAGQEPSEIEVALREERTLLKDERAQRRAQGLLPGPTALDRLVRTHHPAPKEKPASSKEAQAAKEAKKPKAHRTRAEKHAEKAAAVEAARRTPKKPAK